MRAWILVLAACGGSKSQESQPQPQPPQAPVAIDTSSPVAPVAIDAAVAAPTPTPVPVPVPPQVEVGQDFIAEARALYRIAGCTEGPLPETFEKDPKFKQVIAKHCKAIAPHVEKFREVYFVNGKKWLAEHVPAGIPSTVVYPFGGGDLLSALAVFPAATETTTVSLELAGDPRTVFELTPAKLDTELAKFRNEVSWLIKLGSNTSVNLSAQQRGALPGQVTSFLLALAIGGYEPVAMRFFKIDEKGTIHYYDKAAIDADTKNAKSLSTQWNKPVFPESFRNVELKFKKPGGAVQVHRHVAWNLGDKELAKDPGLLRHLEAKGKVTMIVKGASYLLWLDDFATMRKYLLDHLAFMLSDSTGLPPMYAKPAGMVQEAWGKYVKPGLPHAVGLKQDHDMRALWKTSVGPAPFRFGYIDSNNNNHLLITKPK